MVGARFSRYSKVRFFYGQVSFLFLSLFTDCTLNQWNQSTHHHLWSIFVPTLWHFGGRLSHLSFLVSRAFYELRRDLQVKTWKTWKKWIYCTLGLVELDQWLKPRTNLRNIFHGLGLVTLRCDDIWAPCAKNRNRRKFSQNCWTKRGMARGGSWDDRK